MNLTTLRPGLLVSLKTSIVGNTEYRRVSLEADHITTEGQRRARWETERTIINPDERAKASQVRSQSRALISRICSSSTFGLLCPEDKKDALDEAIKEAQAMAAEFNNTAMLTRVHVYIIAGRIAADDVEAVRAINSEVRGLLSDMEAGIKNLDVKVIREAANKAKSIGRMLTPEAAERVKQAVEVARASARSIVKAGEEASVLIDRAAIRNIAKSRTMFLDLDEDVVEVKAPSAKSRAVDLEPELPMTSPKKKGRGPQLELEG